MEFGTALSLINGKRKESSFTGISGRETDKDDKDESTDEREHSFGSE